MEDSTRKLIEEQDKIMRGKRVLDFFNCDFKVDDSSRLAVKINDFALNMIDINCERENVFGGPFFIRFNNDLNLEEGNVTECEWDEADEVLKINGIEARIVDTDLYYFIQSFGADFTKSMHDVMKNFCIWVRKNYM